MIHSRATAIAALAILMPAAAMIGGCSRSTAPALRNTEQPIPVITSPVERRAVSVTLNVVGTVESTANVIVQSRVDGQITRVFVRDGEEVKAEQRLLQIDPQPFVLQLRMAQATLARDEAMLESARSKAAHGEILQKQHYLAQDDYTQLKTSMDTAAATVEQDKAALDSARLQLSYTTIVAPIAGKIGHIAQQVGNTVRASSQTALATLNALDTVEVSFAIPEQQFAPLRQAIVTAASALPVIATATGNAEPHSTGELTFIDNTADPATGTIRLRARFDNHERVLWPGQLVDVVLALPAIDSSLVIPDAAVNQSDRGNYVFVIRNGAVAEQRAIKVLRTAAGFAVVNGVHTGEQVVVDGQSRLTPDAPVRVQNKAAA